jgi:hypothetical protein
MNIAVSLKQFLAENRAELTRELRELDEKTGGNAFSSLMTGLDGLYLTAPEKLDTSEDFAADVKFVLYSIFASLSGITVHFQPGTSPERMMGLQGTIEKKMFQSFLKRYTRAKTAYAFRAAGSEDDLEVDVRDNGVVFLRKGWNSFLDSSEVVSEFLVEVDCTGSGETLQAIVNALEHSLTTAVAAFTATFRTGEGWTPVVSERAKEAQAASALVEAWVSTLGPEAQQLVMKYPKALELFVKQKKKLVA